VLFSDPHSSLVVLVVLLFIFAGQQPTPVLASARWSATRYPQIGSVLLSLYRNGSLHGQFLSSELAEAGLALTRRLPLTPQPQQVDDDDYVLAVGEMVRACQLCVHACESFFRSRSTCQPTFTR